MGLRGMSLPPVSRVTLVSAWRPLFNNFPIPFSVTITIPFSVSFPVWSWRLTISVATWRARLHTKVGTASLKQIQNLEELHLCVSHKLPLSKKTVISHPGRKKERKKVQNIKWIVSLSNSGAVSILCKENSPNINDVKYYVYSMQKFNLLHSILRFHSFQNSVHLVLVPVNSL